MPKGVGALPKLLAIVGPALLLAGGAAWLGAPTEFRPTESAINLDSRLAKEAPEILIVGNSKSGSDIDLGALKAQLGLKGRASVVNTPGTNMPTWYAVVENHVVPLAKKPRLVVIYGTLDWILGTTVSDQLQRAGLAMYIGPTEPVLNPKVFGRSGGAAALDRARDRAATFRIGLTDAVKHAAIRQVAADEAGVAAKEAALAALFEGRSAEAGGHRAIPVVEDNALPAAAAKVPPADGLVPDLISLCDAAGIRLVFVRSALPNFSKEDKIDAETVRETIALLNARGAGWLDLSQVTNNPRDFADVRHMNASGRKKTTAALAEGLQALGALGAGEMAEARAPLPSPTWRREGEPVTLLPPEVRRYKNTTCGWRAAAPELQGLDDVSLAKAGLGLSSPVRLTVDGVALRMHAAREDYADQCAGAALHQGEDVRFSPPAATDAPVATLSLADGLPGPDSLAWVYPGTTLVGTLDVGTTPVDLTMDVTLRVAHGSGAVDVQLGDTTVRLESGERRRAKVKRSGVTGPISLRVASEAAWVIVESVAMEEPTRRTFVVGADGGAAPFLDKFTEVVPAPDVPPVTWRAEGKRRVATLDVPGLATVDAAAVQAALGDRSCVPLSLTVNGKIVNYAPSPPDADQPKPGGWTLRGADLWLGAPGAQLLAGVDPAVTIDKDRQCGLGTWLRPGETLRSNAPNQALQRMTVGGAWLSVDAVVFGDADGTLPIRIETKKLPPMELTLSTAELRKGPVRIQLPTQLAPRAVPVTLTLAASVGAPWVFFRGFTLEQEETVAVEGGAGG